MKPWSGSMVTGKVASAVLFTVSYCLATEALPVLEMPSPERWKALSAAIDREDFHAIQSLVLDEPLLLCAKSSNGKTAIEMGRERKKVFLEIVLARLGSPTPFYMLDCPFKKTELAETEEWLASKLIGKETPQIMEFVAALDTEKLRRVVWIGLNREDPYFRITRTKKEKLNSAEHITSITTSMLELARRGDVPSYRRILELYRYAEIGTMADEPMLAMIEMNIPDAELHLWGQVLSKDSFAAAQAAEGLVRMGCTRAWGIVGSMLSDASTENDWAAAYVLHNLTGRRPDFLGEKTEDERQRIINDLRTWFSTNREQLLTGQIPLKVSVRRPEVPRTNFHEPY